MLRNLKESLANVRDAVFGRRSTARRLRGQRAARLAFEPLEPRRLLQAGPLITEFLAKNDTILQDEDDDYSDWIEVHNPTDTAVDLDGWRLTDDATELAKWTFPAVTIQPQDYLVVFASDKDRRVAGSELHTNFRLTSNGEYLGLIEADGVTVAHDYTSDDGGFPPQSGDVSYGLLGEIEVYFDYPTPGEPNDFVVINEFMAINNTVLQDEDADFSDWIEIHNPTEIALELDGWYLTDDDANPTKWQFPNSDPDLAEITIEPGAYLIVFASGKDRTDPAGELHTNFQLADAGGYLGLFRPNGVTARNEFSPFPAQYADLSYGLSQGQEEFFINPTPGSENVVVFVDMAFSQQRGFYDAAFDLAIASDPSDATIYYTLDGSQPSETNGVEYTQPISVATTTTLRAVALKPGYRQEGTTHSYIFLADVLQQPANPPGLPANLDYEMDPNVVRALGPWGQAVNSE